MIINNFSIAVTLCNVDKASIPSRMYGSPDFLVLDLV